MLNTTCMSTYFPNLICGNCSCKTLNKIHREEVCYNCTENRAERNCAECSLIEPFSRGTVSQHHLVLQLLSHYYGTTTAMWQLLLYYGRTTARCCWLYWNSYETPPTPLLRLTLVLQIQASSVADFSMLRDESTWNGLSSSIFNGFGTFVEVWLCLRQ